MSRDVFRTCALCVGGILCPLAAHGEKLRVEPIPVSLIAGAKTVASKPAPSPDGQFVAFVVANAAKRRPLSSEWPDNELYLTTGAPSIHAGHEVWLLDLKTGQSLPLHPQALTSFGPAWSPDGGRMAFYSDLDGSLGLWIWDLQTGKGRRVASAVARPAQVDSSPVWIGADRIAAKFLPDGMTPQEALDFIFAKRKPVTGDRDAVTVVVRDELAYTFREDFYSDLSIVDLRTGQVRRVVEGKNIWNWELSPDGTAVAYDVFTRSATSDFNVVSLRDGALKFSLHEQKFGPAYEWSTDGRYLYYEPRSPVTYAGEVKTASGGLTIDARTWKSTPGTVSKENRYQRRISGREGSLVDLQDIGRYADLWWLDDAKRAKPRRLTQLNPELDRYASGTAMTVHWTDPQGRQLNGALLLPSGYVSAKRYPLHVNVYGGAQSQASLTAPGLMGNFSPQWNYQVLASRGYAVFIPQAPYGHNTVRRDVADAVLSGVDRVIEMGIADPARLSIEGQSFGGYCVRAVITSTTRFKSAISSAGASGNLMWLYPNGDYSQHRMTADLYRDRDILIANAPMFFYDKVATPLLIQVGMNDGIGNNEETNWDFTTLRHLGKKVQLLQYYGEGHGISGYANQIDFWNRRIEWLEKHAE